MRITDLLSASSIDLNAKPLNKKEAIEQAVKLMAASGNITDIEAYTKQVIARKHNWCWRGNCHTTRQMQCGKQTGTCSYDYKGWS